jgi:hypothetical protein
LGPLLDGGGPNRAVPMPDRAAADKFEPRSRATRLSTAGTIRTRDRRNRAGYGGRSIRRERFLVLDEPQMMPFRFVHPANVHLDSPLATLALRDPGLADLIGGRRATPRLRLADEFPISARR